MRRHRPIDENAKHQLAITIVIIAIAFIQHTLIDKTIDNVVITMIWLSGFAITQMKPSNDMFEFCKSLMAVSVITTCCIFICIVSIYISDRKIMLARELGASTGAFLSGVILYFWYKLKLKRKGPH